MKCSRTVCGAPGYLSCLPVLCTCSVSLFPSIFTSSLSLSLFPALSISGMQEQKEALTARADAAVAEQLTLEEGAGALRLALGNITASLRQLAPTGASPSPELGQTNRTGPANDTAGVSPGRHLRSANGIFFERHYVASRKHLVS